MIDLQLQKLCDAAEQLEITASKLRALIDEGKLAAYRIGPKSFRVPLSEVERLKQTRKT